MTEQEAFEQYWGRKESETQEFQHPDFKKCKVTWEIACEWQRSECNEELVMLRQRVAELEESEKSWIERGNYWTDEAAKMNAELAALKIDNGLTIAYMSGFHDGKKSAQKRGEPVLYQCTKCGGANYACDCDSFRYCTKPLYAEPQTCFSAGDMADAAAKAAQVEREECARLCDSLTEGFAATTTWDSAVLNCSQHIRMRGEEAK